MTLNLKKQQCKFTIKEQLQLRVDKAIHVKMNEIHYDNNGTNKTLITDGLGLCAAVIITGKDLSFTTAFTHMSSTSTTTDDVRKEIILNHMLKYVLSNNTLADIKLLISPSGVKEDHLIQCINTWAKRNNIAVIMLEKGGDSAVFHIDKEGNSSVFSTSLTHLENTGNNSWKGQGIVINHHTFLYQAKHITAHSALSA